MEEIKIKRPKRLILEVTDEDHAEVKRRAAIRQLNVSKWLTQAIKMYADWEDQKVQNRTD